MITNLTRATVELSVDGRKVTMHGEAYLPGHGSPAFVAYRNTLRAWDDGTELTEPEKQAAIDDLLADAQARGWEIEVE